MPDTYFELGAINYGATFLGQVASAPISPNVNFARNGTAGALANTFMARLSESPSVEFASTDIKGFIDVTGTTGTTLVTNPLELYYLAMADGGTYGTGANHSKAEINAGYIMPTSISCENQGVATIGSMLTVKYDGTNEPVIFTTGETAPASSADADRIYTVDKLSVDGVEYIIDSFELDFGINLVVRGSTGSLAPTYVAYDLTVPTVSFTSNDYSKLATLNPTGAIDTDIIIYLARLSKGATRYADNETEHIKITIPQGHIRQSQVPNARKNPGQIPYTIEGLFDGTNSPLAIDTASTIV